MVTVFWRNSNREGPLLIGQLSPTTLQPQTVADMNSPLPDSSQLEAGIIEDTRPSRLSRVQDNVRDLLRNSVFGSVRGSPTARSSSHWARTPRVRGTPPQSPSRSPPARPEVLPSPTNSSSSDDRSTCSNRTTSPFQSNQEVPGILFPPTTHQSYQQAVQHMAHQSALFNARAAAAINHPDLSDSSLTSLEKEKSEHHHRHAATRQGSQQHSSHGARHYNSNSTRNSSRNTVIRRNASSWILSVLSGLLLSALVATYLALITTSQQQNTTLTPTFHILFVLGILLALIVFAHTVLRLCVSRSGKRHNMAVRTRSGAAGAGRSTSHARVLILPAFAAASSTYTSSTTRGQFVRKHRHNGRCRHNDSNPHRHHHTRHRPHQHRRQMPPQPISSEESFVPPIPIPVQVASDESLHTPITITQAPIPNLADTIPSSSLPQPPPPAYGRWRGSVRADPDLLHWQVTAPGPSPVESDIPSPTYQEREFEEDEAEVQMGRRRGENVAGTATTGPPSYVTRDSPARVAAEQKQSRERSERGRPQAAVNQAMPEMVEVRSGVGMAL